MLLLLFSMIKVITCTCMYYIPKLYGTCICVTYYFRDYLRRFFSLKVYNVFIVKKRFYNNKFEKLIDLIILLTQSSTSSQLGDNAFTLFYGKFRANAPRVKALMEQLEIRLDKSPE